nr:reverse transcriptase domain-containing protein [Tanacetum cinerariifolium]
MNVDSKLVANQVLGTYVAKEDNMIKYLEIVKGLVNGFTTFSISQVLVEVLEDKFIKEKEVAAVIEEDGPTWVTQLVDYLKEGVLLGDNKEARKLRLKARQYELREGVLYRRSFLTPWLRCVGPLQADYVMREIHEGSCSMHAGPRYTASSQVAMDYFTKWVEAKAVATITGGQVKKFVWDNIVCRFVIPAEIEMPTYRTAAVDVVNNDKELRLNLDLLEEHQERAAVCEARAKSKKMKYYNARVRGVAFKPGDFVYRSNDASHAVAGEKLGPNWEGPYEVTEALGNGAYKLRCSDRMMLPITWNVTNLKRMLKFSVEGGIATIRSTILIPTECASVTTSSVTPEERTRPANFTVVLHPDFPDQEVIIGGSLSDKGRTELCSVLKKNLDIFVWQPSDMTGVPRSVAEHRLNIQEGYTPVRQKKRGQAPERARAIQAEVQKLVDVRIMREVYYHDWLSNPVMVKKHDGSWRMCVDFTDLNRACPQDCYPLSEIDRKVESLCGYPLICFLDAYKCYHQIQLAEADEEKTAFHTGQGVYCYTKMPFGLKNAGATHIEAEMARDVEETFRTLRKVNMKLNPKKCSFELAEGVFLGYVITHEGIKPCPDKTAARDPDDGKRNNSNADLLHKPGLQGSVLNYSPIEKLVLSLVFAAKRLRWYFQAHHIMVITDQPIKQVMTRPDAARRLQKWSIMLGEYNITYRPMTSVKGQILADFLVEMPGDVSQAAPAAVAQEKPWTLFTDGSSCVDGSGAGLILTNPEGVEFTYALRFQFAASNNEAEYEALVTGLRIATQTGVKSIQVNVDSKLVANQVLGTYVAKEDNMIKYLEIVKGLVNGFTTFSISQVLRSKNKQADALSKIASTSLAHLSKQVLVEVLEDKSIMEKEVAAVIEEDGPTWMTQLVDYLKEGVLPGDNKEARKLRLKARQYELMEGVLYRRSFLTPWLRCVGPLQADYVMREIHEGSCSMHAGPRSIVAKAIRLGPLFRRAGEGQVSNSRNRLLHKVGEIISDNGKQFADNPFKDWCDKLNITQRFASVKHPQSNGLVERANQSLGEGIKARLGEVIPAEIGMPTYRTAAVDVVNNDKELRLNLDLLEEHRERAVVCEARAKSKMMKYYNARVRGVAFKPGDFVYRSNDASHAVAGGKLGSKWEGPYEVIEALGNRAYKLRYSDGTMLPRTWNVTNLKRCYL